MLQFFRTFLWLFLVEFLIFVLNIQIRMHKNVPNLSNIVLKFVQVLRHRQEKKRCLRKIYDLQVFGVYFVVFYRISLYIFLKKYKFTFNSLKVSEIFSKFLQILG